MESTIPCQVRAVTGRICDRLQGQSGGEPVARAESVLTTRGHFGAGRYWVIALDRDMPGTPLGISEVSPSVGDVLDVVVFGPRRHHLRHREVGLAQSAVVASSNRSFTLARPGSLGSSTGPAFDAEGNVLAFVGHGGVSRPIGEILAGHNLSSRRRVVSPTLGIRVGTAFGGPLDRPLTGQIDLGLVFWDQLGLSLSFGAAGTRETVRELEARNGRGPGALRDRPHVRFRNRRVHGDGR